MASKIQKRKRSYRAELNEVKTHNMSDDMIKKVCSVIDDRSHPPCTTKNAGGKCNLYPVNADGLEQRVQEFLGDCLGFEDTENESEEVCLQKTRCFCDLRNIKKVLSYTDKIDCMCKGDEDPKAIKKCACKYAGLTYIPPCECNSFFRVQCDGSFNSTLKELSVECKTKLNTITNFEENLPCCSNKYLLKDFEKHNKSDCSHITTTTPPTTAPSTTPKKVSKETTPTTSKTQVETSHTYPALNLDISTTELVPIPTSSSGLSTSNELELVSNSGSNSKQIDTWMDIYNPICIATPIGLILIFVLLFLARRFYVKYKNQRSHRGAERFY